MLTRREAIKGAVAAGVAGLLPVSWIHRERARTLDVDLTPFCESDLDGGGRYKIDRPFRLDEWTYATDARIAVRVEGLTDSGDADGTLPPMHTLQFDHDAIWRPWPVLERRYPGPYGATCKTCNGAKRTAPTHYCEFQSGSMWCEDGKLLEVNANGETIRWGKHDRCDGTGVLGGDVCPECNGKGETDYCANIGGLAIAPYYWRIVNELQQTVGRVEYAISQPRADDSRPCVAFRFDGGTGLCIPMVG